MIEQKIAAASVCDMDLGFCGAYISGETLIFRLASAENCAKFELKREEILERLRAAWIARREQIKAEGVRWTQIACEPMVEAKSEYRFLKVEKCSPKVNAQGLFAQVAEAVRASYARGECIYYEDLTESQKARFAQGGLICVDELDAEQKAKIENYKTLF